MSHPFGVTRKFAPLEITGDLRTYSHLQPQQNLNVEESEKKWGKRVDDALVGTWKHQKFRENQRSIILAILGGRDTFVLMPTGGGKSLCFQLPALLLPGVTIVISPLIALMQNQVAALHKLGIKAHTLNSSLAQSESDLIYSDLRSLNPKTKLLYVTPELITTAHFQRTLTDLHRASHVSLCVIDEAHCISSWGHDFRPAFLKLQFFKEHLSGVPVAAFTATANERVKDDIVRILQMKAPAVFITSFNRPNISYEIRYKTLLPDVFTDIRAFLKQRQGQSGLIYCHKREDCDDLAQKLTYEGMKVAAYHAGLNDTLREQTLKKWTSNEIPVIAATIAFGMGIDKPDVRFVIHHTVPKTIEGFYQESGRAGRDGQPSLSILYYSRDDKNTMEFLISKQGGMVFGRGKKTKDTNQTDIQMQAATNAFEKMIDYCEGLSCRRKKLLAYFGERPTEDICKKTCDYCKNPQQAKKNVEMLSANNFYSSSKGSGFRVKDPLYGMEMEEEDDVPESFANAKGFVKFDKATKMGLTAGGSDSEDPIHIGDDDEAFGSGAKRKGGGVVRSSGWAARPAGASSAAAATACSFSAASSSSKPLNTSLPPHSAGFVSAASLVTTKKPAAKGVVGATDIKKMFTASVAKATPAFNGCMPPESSSAASSYTGATKRILEPISSVSQPTGDMLQARVSRDREQAQKKQATDQKYLAVNAGQIQIRDADQLTKIADLPVQTRSNCFKKLTDCLLANQPLRTRAEAELLAVEEEYAIFRAATSRITYVAQVMKKTNAIEAATRSRTVYT